MFKKGKTKSLEVIFVQIELSAPFENVAILVIYCFCSK